MILPVRHRTADLANADTVSWVLSLVRKIAIWGAVPAVAIAMHGPWNDSIRKVNAFLKQQLA